MKYQTINAGDHFGRLETLERIKIGRRIAWICKCSCGNTRAVLSQNLNNGTTKSCGCYNREAASQLINVMSKTGKFDISKKRDSKNAILTFNLHK